MWSGTAEPKNNSGPDGSQATGQQAVGDGLNLFRTTNSIDDEAGFEQAIERRAGAHRAGYFLSVGMIYSPQHPPFVPARRSTLR